MGFIEGLEVRKIDVCMEDRGALFTIWDEKDYGQFVQDKISLSHRGVWRGLHGDSITDKLVCCLSGRCQLIVVDARRNSKTRGNVVDLILDQNDVKTVFIPHGCMNGHLSLSEPTMFYYKWSIKYQGPEKQVTLNWDNELLDDIEWQLDRPFRMNGRDKLPRNFKDIQL